MSIARHNYVNYGRSGCKIEDARNSFAGQLLGAEPEEFGRLIYFFASPA
jgi:hypothetical protein